MLVPRLSSSNIILQAVLELCQQVVDAVEPCSSEVQQVFGDISTLWPALGDATEAVRTAGAAAISEVCKTLDTTR